MATAPLPREPVLSVEEFGLRLIATGDLDPVYVMLAAAKLPHDQLCRWLVAYWCFYHAGVASYLSEHESLDAYWGEMRTAAVSRGNVPWPRNVERRHFRGEKAFRAVDALSGASPERLVWGLCAPDQDVISVLWKGVLTQETVMTRAQKWPLFGPWIAFKVADMLEVLGLARVQFDRSLPLIFDEPRKALAIVAAQRGFAPQDALAMLLLRFSSVKAPVGDRMCGVQEVETVLCKWKSHQGGHHSAYWVGHDVAGLHRDLAGWGGTAATLALCAPPVLLDAPRPCEPPRAPVRGRPGPRSPEQVEAQRALAYRMHAERALSRKRDL